MLNDSWWMIQKPMTGFEKPAWLHGVVSMVGFRWQTASVHTRGDKTLRDAKGFNDSSCIATLLFEIRRDLGSWHVNGVFSLGELVDLLENHIKNVEPTRTHHRR